MFKKCTISFLFQAWHWTSSVLSISKTRADLRSIQPYIFNLPHHTCSWSNILNLFLFLENSLKSSLALGATFLTYPSSWRILLNLSLLFGLSFKPYHALGSIDNNFPCSKVPIVAKFIFFLYAHPVIAPQFCPKYCENIYALFLNCCKM